MVGRSAIVFFEAIRSAQGNREIETVLEMMQALDTQMNIHSGSEVCRKVVN